MKTIVNPIFIFKKGSNITEKSNIFFVTFLLLGFLTAGSKAFAGTITTTGSGNWSSTVPNAPWPGGTIPATGDDIVIGNGFTLTVDGNRTCNSVSFTSSTSGSGSGSGTLTVNSGFQLTVTTAISAPAAGMGVKTDITYTIAGLGTISAASLNCNNTSLPSGGATSIIKVISTITALNISGNIVLRGTRTGPKVNNPTFNLQSGTVTVNGSITSVNTGAANVATMDLVTSASGPTLILSGATPFNFSGTGINTTNFDGTGATVIYNYAGAQTVRATTYNNVTLAASGNKTTTGVTVNGTLSMQGTAAAITTSPTFGPLSTLEYKGSTAQVSTNIEYPASGGPNSLTIDNSNGLTLNGNKTVNGTLLFTNGKITTGVNKISLSANATTSGAGPGKYIYGNEEIFIPNGTAPTRTFAIGDATNYTPATVDFSGTTTGSGSLTAYVTSGDDADIANSGLISSLSVNRTWSITNNGVDGFTSFGTTFSFVAGDIDGGATTSNFVTRKLLSSAWTASTLVAANSLSTQASGMTSFGVFQIGEPYPITVSAHPSNITDCSGNSTSFSAGSVSTPTPTVKWQRDPNTGVFTDITGAMDGGVYTNFATATLSVSNIAGLGNYKYRAVFTNINGSATTNSATLTVTPIPSATFSYSGTPYCSNAGTASVTFSGTTGGVYSSTAGLSIDATTGDVILGTSTIGTYTVTYTVSPSGGCAIYSTTTSITVTAGPAATISYTGTPYCSTAGTATVTFSGTTGGTYSSTAGLSINPVTGDVDLGASTLGTYIVTYTVAASGGCPQLQTTESISIVTSGTWTGAIDNNWNDGGNWLCGQIPVSTTNVIIPGSLFNYPIVDATNPLNNLTIQTGASVTVSGGNLQIGGSITNSGTFDVSGGTIEMNGSSPQVIPANSFANNTILNLNIHNNVTLEGLTNLTGALSFGTNNNTLTTGGYLTLKSTASGTARLADITNGGAISGNTISGQVTIERYIPALRAWRLLAAPLSATGAPTINEAWQEGVTTGNPNPGYGVQITGGTTTNGFDQGINTNPSVKIFNSGTNTLVGLPSIPGTYTPITTYPGYFLFVRGNRSTNLLQGVNAAITPTTLRMKGNLNTGNVGVNINALTTTLVGNPYPAAVDFHSLTKSNVQDKLYVWDPKLGGINGVGGYVTLIWNTTTSTYDATTSVSPVSQYIQSGAAFLVESLDGTNPGTLTFKETDKNATGSDFVFRPVNNNTKVRINLLAVGAGGTSYFTDGVLTTYDKNNVNAVDHNDAKKLYNIVENICIGRDSKMLAIERRQMITTSDTTFLNVYNLKKQNYKLQITVEGMVNSGLVAVIKDNYSTGLNNTPVNLEGNTEFIFNVNADAGSYAANRFSIVFAKQSLVSPFLFYSVKTHRRKNAIAVAWNTENESKAMRYEVEKSETGLVFSPAVTIKAKTNNGGGSAYNWVDSNATEGINYYRIKSIDLAGKVNFSTIVKADSDNANTEKSIKVFGNNFKSNKVNIQFSNLEKGNYRIQLFSLFGQLINSVSVNHGGGNSVHSFTIKNYLAPGKYQVQVIGNSVNLTTPVIRE